MPVTASKPWGKVKENKVKENKQENYKPR